MVAQRAAITELEKIYFTSKQVSEELINQGNLKYENFMRDNFCSTLNVGSQGLAQERQQKRADPGDG